MKNRSNCFINTVFMCFLLSSIYSFAQNTIGYDNFSPAASALRNPAHLSDSRLRGEIGIFGNFFASETEEAPGFDKFNLHPDNLFNMVDFDSNIGEGTAVGVLEQNADVQLNLNLAGFKSLNDYWAVGATYGFRSSINYRDFDRELWSGLANGFGQNDFAFNQVAGNVASHYWTETGVSVAWRTPVEDYYSYSVKIGGSLKWVQGVGYSHMVTLDDQSISGSYNATNSQLTLQPGRFEYIQTFSSLNPKVGDFLKNRVPGFNLAGDFGISVELRSRETAYGGAVMKNEKANNKYFLKLSAAILDLGQIDYGEQERDTIGIATPITISVSRNDSASQSGNSGTNLYQSLKVFDDPSAENIDGFNAGNLKVTLPTAALFEADVMVMSNIYFNASYTLDLVPTQSRFATRRPQVLGIVPRYEEQNFSVYIPVGFNLGQGSDGSGIQALGVGIGVRYQFAGASIPILAKKVNQASIMATVPFYEDWDDAYNKNSKSDKNRRRNKKRR